MICGCIPVVYPIKDMSKQEYAKKHMCGVERGYAYGKDDIQNAEKTLEDGVDDFFTYCKKEDDTIYSFLNDLQCKIESGWNC
jgi:hypothetical protein